MAKGNDGKRENGEGTTRRLSSGKYECIVQSKYMNPKHVKKRKWIWLHGKKRLSADEILR